MKCRWLHLAILVCLLQSGCIAAFAATKKAETQSHFVISRAKYLDRAHAVWVAQMIGQVMGLPFEHKPASALKQTPFALAKGYAEPDDDYYYEMVAIRAFEKYGIHMTVEQLGAQWLENNAGTWGSSEQTLLLLKQGIKPPATGYPRYNKLWWTIGPQFSSDVYGILAPGMPNVAAEMARRLGHINGYAEGTDGAVFIASMVSLGFVETDSRQIVRKAAHMISPQSPYRQCLDTVISMAEAGKGPEEIARVIDERWGIEYPASNNAVLNGGIVAISVWFGGGNFSTTENLSFRLADFADTDCNAANAAAVVAAMHGMSALPADAVAALHDRVRGEKMGPVFLTPPVDESISTLAERTVALGEKILLEHGARIENNKLRICREQPVAQAAELFTLNDLGKLWNANWSLERAGYGGAGGGIRGIRGNTHLEDNVLAVFPRDEVRGAVLRRSVELSESPSLSFDAGADQDKTWRLMVYVNNDRVFDRKIQGSGAGRHWEKIQLDLSKYKQQAVQIRIYDLVLVPGFHAGNAYFRSLHLQ